MGVEVGGEEDVTLEGEESEKQRVGLWRVTGGVGASELALRPGVNKKQSMAVYDGRCV